MSSISQEKLDLIRQLARKQAAARSVSVSDGPHTMLSLYERNNLLQALSEHHRLYDPVRGRLFPLFNEDFEGEEEGLPQHDLEEDEALGDVLYHWTQLQKATSLMDFADHLNLMDNAISALIWYAEEQAGERPF